MTNCFNEIYLRYNLHQFQIQFILIHLTFKNFIIKTTKIILKQFVKKRISTSYYHYQAEANNYQSHLKKGFAIVLNDQREIIRGIKSKKFNKKSYVFMMEN